MSTACETMAELANSWYLRGALIYSLITSLMCLPIAIYGFYRIGSSQITHFNSKCVFISMYIALLVHCGSRSILHSIDLYNYFSSWVSGCRILPNHDRCLLRTPYKYTQFMIETSTIMSTIERVVATFFKNSYENRMKWLGILLILFHNFFAFSLTHIMYTDKTYPPVVYYCTLSHATVSIYDYIPEGTILVLQTITFFVSTQILKINDHNQKLFQSSQSLSQRFLIRQNLRSIALFKSACLITLFYVSLSDFAMILDRAVLTYQTLSYRYANLELIQCVPTYFLIRTYAFLRIDKKFTEERAFKIVKINDNHFAGLQKQFDDAFFQKRKF